MNLREARIREERAALVRAPGGRHVRVHGVGRQVVDRAVAAGAEQHRLAVVPFELAGDEVSRDDAARLAVDDDQVEHFARGNSVTVAGVDLSQHRLIRAEQQLLTCLTRARRTFATPARRRTSGCRAARRTRGRTARRCATHWSMMSTLSCASR